MHLVKNYRLPPMARQTDVMPSTIAQGATLAMEYLGIAAIVGGAFGWALIQLAV